MNWIRTFVSRVFILTSFWTNTNTYEYVTWYLSYANREKNCEHNLCYVNISIFTEHTHVHNHENVAFFSPMSLLLDVYLWVMRSKYETNNWIDRLSHSYGHTSQPASQPVYWVLTKSQLINQFPLCVCAVRAWSCVPNIKIIYPVYNVYMRNIRSFSQLL